MKKIISIFMAILFVGMISIPAFASETNKNETFEVEVVEFTSSTTDSVSGIFKEFVEFFDLVKEFFVRLKNYIKDLIYPSNGYYLRFLYEEDGDVIKEYIFEEGSIIEVKIPSFYKRGYKFIGWSPEIPEVMPANDVTCVAQWEKVYELQFWEDEGKNNLSNYFFKEGDTINVKAPTIEKDGYKFIGWSPEIPEIMPANDVICVAQWEILDNYSTITIILPNDAYIFDSEWFRNELTKEEGSKIERPKEIFRTNYAVAEFVDENGQTIEFPETMPKENMTIWVKWREKTDCKVVWKVKGNNENGKVVDYEIVQYYDKGDWLDYLIMFDDFPSYTQYGIEYYFVDWSREYEDPVMGDATYVAIYAPRLK